MYKNQITKTEWRAKRDRHPISQKDDGCQRKKELQQEDSWNILIFQTQK